MVYSWSDITGKELWGAAKWLPWDTELRGQPGHRQSEVCETEHCVSSFAWPASAPRGSSTFPTFSYIVGKICHTSALSLGLKSKQANTRVKSPCLLLFRVQNFY